MNTTDIAIPPLTQRQRDQSLIAQLRGERTSWERTFQDLGDYIAPYLGEWQLTDTNDGSRKDSFLINETAWQALEVGKSGLFNGLCDPTETWMGLELSNPKLAKSHAGRVWCEEATEALLGELPKSNFYSVAPEDFGSILAFGNCASVTLEEFQNPDTCVWFMTCPMGSYFVGNDSRRRPRIFAREMRMTAMQLLDEFGAGRISATVKAALTSGQSQRPFDILHLVQPNPAFQPGRLLSKDKRIRSCYFDPSDKEHEYLAEEGFDSHPVQVGRWWARGNASYAFGPGHMALGSAKALQAYETDLALARELYLNPSLIAPPGTNLAALSMLPGGVTIAQDTAGSQGLRPLREFDFDLNAGKDGIIEVEDRIRDAFYNNIFLMIANDDGGKMTAREVMERAREKRLALTPILRLTEEYLTPRIARVLEIMGKRGKLPPFPPELAGQQLRVVFKSVLAEAAQLEKAAAIGQHMIGFTLPLAEVFPDMLDNYDPDTLARDHAIKSGVPASDLRDPKKVEELRAARAEEQAKAATAERVNVVADTAKKLSETDTSGKNALTDIAQAVQQ